MDQVSKNEGIIMHGGFIKARSMAVGYGANVVQNIDTIQSRAEFISLLEEIKTELLQAKNTKFINDEEAIDADYSITKAIQQAKEADSDKKTIQAHLNAAKTVIEGVSATGGLVNALTKATELVSKFF